MEMELEPRVKPLTFQVKATSRESTPQKATHVLDCDIRTHWSTGTNTKEWILLELDEPCLLSHLRIYNKSVLEWEISVGLQYKPEAFVKVRPRCEAPRRDMMYPMSYTPCRFVRIACLRGNPIAIYFIQLIGVSVTGLGPEFQPVVNYLLPHIISHKQEVHDMHLQLLQDITSRLPVFLPQLETDLANFTDEDIRFFAMLTGPFYPILHILKEREIVKPLTSSDPDVSKISQTSTLTVSSNFEAQPRRSCSPSFINNMSCSLAFRPDALLLLLKEAYKDPLLGTVCVKAAKVLHMLVKPTVSAECSKPVNNSNCSSISDEVNKNKTQPSLYLSDYSSLFGETFRLHETCEDATYFNLLDIAAVEEGIIHVLYACAAEPLLCSKLADNNSDILSVLPLVQALLPALRPPFSSPDKVDDTFSQWKHSSIRNALSQIVLMASSSVYRPLVRACAGYLSSFSSTHIKAACLLIDLCCGPLSPWISVFINKVDLAVELMEDLLLDIQGASRSIIHARAALKFVILALSGHMDDVLTKYKENKHKLLFLLEMLEPFLDPAIVSVKSSISFGVSTVFSEEEEIICVSSLNIICAATQKPAVLSSLELEWRSGSVVPSVLLSILGPNIQLPPDIDLCKSSTSKLGEQESHSITSGSRESGENTSEPVLQTGTFEDLNLLFAPQDLKKTTLINSSYKFETPDKKMESGHSNVAWEMSENPLYHLQLDSSFFAEFFNTQADYLQLLDHHDCETMSSEFQKLALDLCSRHDITKEDHDAAIDALLLAAECYVNPFFLISVRPASKLTDQLAYIKSKITKDSDIMELGRNSQNDRIGLDKIARLEPKRDKAVLQLLLKAAKLNVQYQGEKIPYNCDLHSVELQSADAVTLIRKNQEMLWYFTMQQLQREHHLSHEILLQILLLLLHSGTELFCSPEDVIDVILLSAEKLSGMFTSLYYQIKEGNTHFDIIKLHVLQRRWLLLQRLILASSGDSGTNIFKKGTNRFQYKCLIPPCSWMDKISEFSKNQYLLPRFLGWMAVSRYAKLYLTERLFLASELSHLTSLLTIFTDELALVNNIGNVEHCKSSSSKDSFVVLYPDWQKFFPDMKKQFENFGETILEAVRLQLKCFPSGLIPELLCWFADVCMWPYLGKNNEKLKGYNAINARAIVLYLLESIVSEHMEEIILEMPNVAQILISLCGATYCDVAFLDAILQILQPLISYFMRKEIVDGKMLNNEISACDFEENFKELFDHIKHRVENQECIGGENLQGPLVIFVLGALFPYFSINKKNEILQCLVDWADFTVSEPTSSYLDYLCAYLKLVDSCHILLVQNMKSFDILKLFQNEDGSTTASQADYSGGNISYDTSDQEFCRLSTEDIKQLQQSLQLIILKLSRAVENSWELHCQLSAKLTDKLCECYLLARCLHSVGQESNTSDTYECRSKHWQNSLEGLVAVIIKIQKNQCWHVCSAMLDYLFKLPCTIFLDCVLSDICTTIKLIFLNAPRISWRMQTDKWLSYLFTKKTNDLDGSVTPVVDLISSMLSHWEPEQRSIAMQHLGRIVCPDNNSSVELSQPLHENLIPESVVSTLVTNTWDRVATLALSDPSMMLRSHATALLSSYIPFADRTNLQSFLVTTNTILRSIGKLSLSLEECFVTRLSLGLLANVCLYSPSEDIVLIPESVWQNLENVGMSKTGGLDYGDKKLCKVLCKLKTDPDGANSKEELKCALSTSITATPSNPDFRSTRESILQVLSSLTSIQSYVDFFSKKADQTSQELDEAEIEMDLLQKEKALEEVSGHYLKEPLGSFKISSNKVDESRLQKIKNNIKSLERSKLRDEVAARSQKKLLMRRARMKILEEAASREMQLLQEIDRERELEMERTMEQQKQLELERAKTKELQFNLDMERERQTQKELQRELEQVESGVRLPRREFSSNSNSRPRERERERDRERYRERDSHRQSNRSTDITASQTAAAGPTTSPASTVVLAGSRSFSGQPPTILQPRDRMEGSSNPNYDDIVEAGSRDSGDGGSVGDPELGSAFDGFGSGQRQGSTRGGKSRQVADRREKEGRRDGGKWERRN